MLQYLDAQSIVVDQAGPALDFGCGVGRLTRALARHFESCTGVDIAPGMIRLARELNKKESGCHFHLNQTEDLTAFPSASQAFVYSNIVLQHMPTVLGLRYVAEFVRLLRPGGVAVFQVPTEYRESTIARLRGALRVRTRLRDLVGDGRLDAKRVAWEMHGTPESQVIETVEGAGGRVLDLSWTNATDPDFNGALRYLDAPPQEGWQSRQYVVAR